MQVNDADLRPLRSTAGAASGAPLPLRMKSRVSLAAGAMTLDDIDAKVGGSSVRGRLAVGDAAPRRIDGAIEADVADVPALLGRAIGLQPQTSAKNTAWNWSSEPFGAGLLGKFAGRVTLKVARADVLSQVTARQFNAALRLGKDELSLEDVTAELAGGRLSGGIVFRSGDDGLTSRLKVSLAGADMTTLLAWTTRPAVGGSLDLVADLTGTGLSPVALVGSLKGSVKIVLADGKIAGLDARVFDVITRAVDQGLVVDTGRISDLARKSLPNGQFIFEARGIRVADCLGSARTFRCVSRGQRLRTVRHRNTRSHRRVARYTTYAIGPQRACRTSPKNFRVVERTFDGAHARRRRIGTERMAHATVHRKSDQTTACD